MPEHRRQRWALRKLSVGMCSVLLGFAVMIPTVPAVGAAEIFAVSDVGIANAGVKELDTSVAFYGYRCSGFFFKICFYRV